MAKKAKSDIKLHTIMSENNNLNVGDMVEAEVFKVTSFGAFVKLPAGQRGLIHISQVADNFVKNISDHLKLGDKMQARIINIDGNKIDLTLKRPKQEKKDNIPYPKAKEFRVNTFEDKLQSFLTKSEERITELKENTQAKQH